MPDIKIKKMNMAAILAIFLSFILISGVAFGNATQVRIGVLAQRGPERCMEKWTPMAQYLTARIPGKTFEIVPLGFDKIIASVEKGNCDFVLANPAFYVELESSFGIDRIATLKNFRFGHAYTRYGGVVFCRADRKDINDFNDLKGKIYAAPDPNSFGAWIAVRRELKDAKIDPYRDLKSIKFVGTQDAVVYAVRDGKADAGSVRTDTLERMAMEGKINIKAFRIIGAREQTKAFPFIHSTRLYPEWPFAKAKHTSDKLAEQVSVALIDMSWYCTAAPTRRCTGWTIPLNYQQVHGCLKELRIGPYKDFGKVTLTSILKTYWPLVLAIFVLFTAMAGALIVYSKLNRKIQMSYTNLQSEIEERKRAEEALQNEKEKFQVLVEESPLGVSIIGKDHNYKYINSKFTEIFGYTLEDIPTGREWFVKAYPDKEYRNQVISAWINDLKGTVHGESRPRTFTVRCKDGSEKVIYFRTVTMEAGDKFITYEDITEQKKAEETLRHSKEQYSALVEESFDGIFIQKGPKIIFANLRLHKMLGYKEGDLVGLDHWLVYHPEYQELTRKRALARMRGEKVTTHYEVKMQRKDGGWFYAEIGARMITTEGEPGIQVWIKDVTERKQAEEALKRSEARLRSVFQVSPLGIGLIQNRQMQWHNEAMFRMSGYSSEELHGKNARMLYQNDEEYERVGEVIKTLGPGKRTTEVETRWVRKDGSAFDCHILYALMDPKSEDSAVLAISEDITERKKAEQERKKLEAQLNQAQKMEAIGVLAGGVAHDFNNILTSIIGNADLAQMKSDKNNPIYKNLGEISRAGERAATLTRQLLAFSRKELIKPVALDLNQVTMNLEKMLRRLIGEDIDLVTAYAPNPCQVEADPGQMEQVIMNLSVNARDAMPKGGKITIETENVELDKGYFREHGVENEVRSYVMLAITDNGIGMDKETQARIFEPFFTTKEVGRGTGLGLSTIYGIVKQNRGYIWVYSEKGKGTTFKVYLPRIEADARDLEKEESSERSLTGSETILVVEDDEMLRDMAGKMIKGYGYSIITARDGKEAIKISGSHDGPIHLLLTDVVMPGMTGRELAEKLQPRFPEIKVLYMSGYTGNAIAHHGVLEKDVEFIQKPFTQEGLASKVREVLDKKKD